MKTIAKSISRFLKFHDWMWSILLGFLAYWLTNWGPSSIGGVPMTYYAINWIQALLATGGIMAGLLFITRLGLYFYFKKIHNYIWGHKYKDLPWTNNSDGKRKFMLFSQLDFKSLTSWQKLLLATFLVSALFCAALVVFLKMLSLAGAS